MCRSVEHPVRTLVRTRVGPVTLGRTVRGHTRRLAKREIADLRALLGLPSGGDEEEASDTGPVPRR
jgi:16S rRNA U516 pseudouridylate synthase RsuA-like enzyme